MKAALFAFNGELFCFAHVLLNAFDMKAKGYEVEIVIEGSATKLVKELYEDPEKPFATQFSKAKEEGLIGCVCKACATKMGSKDSAVEQGLTLAGDMSGHPSLSSYLEKGYQVFTF